MIKYFYCQSYQMFSLALRYRMEHEVTVITGAPNIIKACKYLNVNCVTHPEFPGYDLITKSGQVISWINKILETVGEDEIHFSHTQYALFCFILIAHAAAKSHKIFFHNFEFLYDRVKGIPVNKRTAVLLLKYHWIKRRYGVPIQLGMSSPGTYMICLQMNFLKEKNICTIHDKNTYFNETLKFFQNIELPISDMNILFIAQTFNNDAFFDKNKINEVINVLNTPLVHVKMHPKVASRNELSQCKELPSFLPVEYFFKSVKRLVISFDSAALVTASRFDHLKVISLLDIVEKKNEFARKVKKYLMEESGHRIVFPQNIAELEQLIN